MFFALNDDYLGDGLGALGRDVLGSCEAFATEVIDVDVVLALHNQLFELGIHLIILYICQHALEDAVVNSIAHFFQHFHNLVPTLVIANVVGYHIEMFLFHRFTILLHRV